MQWRALGLEGVFFQVLYPGDTGVNRLSPQQGNWLAIHGFLLRWRLYLQSYIRPATGVYIYIQTRTESLAEGSLACDNFIALIDS